MCASEGRPAGENSSSLPDVTAQGWQPTLPIVASLLTAVVVARSALASWTIQQGFVEYNADGFSRIIRGWEWLQAPRWEVEVWLPLHFWLYGIALAVWDEIYLAPRILNFVLAIVTILLIYGIGSRLFDRRAGLIAAGIAAVFPYEVWLSISGMSEPLFHVLIAGAVFGLVSWWVERQEWLLIPAGLALAAATAVRYEAWFYAVTFVLVIGFATWYFRRDFRYPLIAGLLAVSFMGVWMQQNYQIHGDAFHFVRATEEIRFVEDPANVEAGFVDRVTFFPRRAIEVAPLLLPTGIVALGYLVLRQPRRWGGFFVIVAVQAALFIGVTAPFASLGPGGERFLLSNLLLLTVPIGAAASVAVARFGNTGLLASGAVLLAILVSFAPDWAGPPDDYPASDTRDLAQNIGEELDAEPEGIAIVLLPEMPDERFNEGYAFRVLSGHPDRVEITDLPSRLYESIQQGEALIWVMDGRVDIEEPAALERAETGAYVTGTPPPPAYAMTDQSELSPGGEITVRGGDFQPVEPVATWWTAPDGDVYAGPDLKTDSEGELEESAIPLPSGAGSGSWALTLSGQESQRQAFVSVEVVR